MSKVIQVDGLKPCPFCGSRSLELRDYTENIYGFWDYKIRCKTCRASMDSPSTAIVESLPSGIRQTRNGITKEIAKQGLILNWNRRVSNEESITYTVQNPIGCVQSVLREETEIKRHFQQELPMKGT